MPDFPPSIIREYDIRGVVGKTLFPDTASRVGIGYAQYLKSKFPGKKLRVSVAYDGRLTSPELVQYLMQGLLSQDIEVIPIGRGPTPMLYFSVFHLDTDGGIMVTGSHNPPDHNGFKMMAGKSSLHGSEIKKIGEIAMSAKAAGADKKIPPEQPIYKEYVERLISGYSGKKNLRVAWDAGSGASGQILKDVTSKLPGTHILLNEKVDGAFPAHHPDPSVEENLHQLQEVVGREKCDIGFAFDGDGDRIGVVDNKGRIFWGDQILLFLSEDIIKKHPGKPIIGDVKCSQILFDLIAKLGGEAVMWKTGHSLIKSKMAELKAPLAGEMSGHIFIADDFYGFDDALYAAIRFMQSLANRAEDLASWRDKLPSLFTTPEIRLDCKEERKFAIIDEVRDRLNKSGIKFNAIDGVRAVTEQGWWLVRASNTQAALAIRCEATSASGLEHLKEQVANQLALSGLKAAF